MFQRTIVTSFIGILLGLAATESAQADVRLSSVFSDHMVLQRGMKVPVWGWANEGETVTVEFRGQKTVATTVNGKWMVRLPSLKAGGPDTMKVTGKNSVVIRDVLVGEVWVCSGQSNMEFPLSASFESKTAIDTAANPNIRLFTVPKLKAEFPVSNVAAQWQECNPDTVKGFSAVGYFFGRDLQKALNVPVGLIHTSWGGSPAEVWMSQDVLVSNPAYQRDILDAYPEQLKWYQNELAKWEKETADLAKEGKQPARGRPWPTWKPTELYNGMIAPLLPYAIKGAIWYQGESNAGRAWQYRTLFADMIRNWRRDWNQGDFTFLAVQLAPFMKVQPEPQESAWAELREAQLLTTQALPKYGMAVITDVGDPVDIHPTKKEPVGGRLALAARGIAYGEKIEYSGPVYKNMKIDGNTIVLSFDHAKSGLEARGGELTGFAIAGSDHKFVWAKAEIKGNKVVVSSPSVAQPVAVRYGWADCPVVNLWNKDGLPATPFRTDDFPMTTKPKQ